VHLNHTAHIFKSNPQSIEKEKRFQRHSIRLDLTIKSTQNLAINPNPADTMSQDQNWNHPVNVPANKKMLATTAAPTQKIRLPIVSAMRLSGERTISRMGIIITWSIAIANMKPTIALKRSI
jgi:hypothetical protein